MTRPRFVRLIALLVLFCLFTPSHGAEPVARRVMIVSIDGLRPDMALRANMPILRSLLPQSCYTFWAQTVPHAITLPSHVSMLTGVVPRRHEIEWNKDLPLSAPVYPKVPTLFEVARAAGYTTAMAAGKSKFVALAKPGTLDWSFVTDSEKCDDADVAERAIQIIREHRPQVMFVHLPSVDNVGHASGWGTAKQIAAIESADAMLGKLLQTLEDTGLRNETVLIVSSDHGGAGLTHLAGDPRALMIPWLITGPGIRKGVDLTIYPKVEVTTMDTFATACRVLGIEMTTGLDGQPRVETLEQAGELMKARAEDK